MERGNHFSDEVNPLRSRRGERQDITPEKLQIETKGRKVYRVNSYMEAAGLLLALRNGIAVESTIRPIPQLKPIFL